MINTEKIYDFLSRVTTKYIDLEQNKIVFQDQSQLADPVIEPSIYINLNISDSFPQLNKILNSKTMYLDEIEGISLEPEVTESKYIVNNNTSISIAGRLIYSNITINIINSINTSLNVNNEMKVLSGGKNYYYYMINNQLIYSILNLNNNLYVYNRFINFGDLILGDELTLFNNFSVGYIYNSKTNQVMRGCISDATFNFNLGITRVDIDNTNNICYYLALKTFDDNTSYFTIETLNESDIVSSNQISSTVDDIFKTTTEYDENFINNDIYFSRFSISNIINLEDSANKVYLAYYLTKSDDSNDKYYLAISQLEWDIDNETITSTLSTINIDTDKVSDLAVIYKEKCYNPYMNIKYITYNNVNYVYVISVQKYLQIFLFKEINDNELSLIDYVEEIIGNDDSESINIMQYNNDTNDKYVVYGALSKKVSIATINFDSEEIMLNSTTLNLPSIYDSRNTIIYNGWLIQYNKPTGININKLQQVEVVWDQNEYNYSSLPVIVTGTAYIKDIVTNEYINGNANIYVLGNDNYFEGHKTSLENIEITTDGYPIKIYVYNPDELGLNGEVIIQEQS